MSGNDISRHDQILLGLVYSFQMGAMQQLGKLQDPASGEIRRDLDQARATISVLEMLKAKCRTDTPQEVLKILDQTVMDLQLNYMEEVKQEEAQAGQAEPDSAEEQEPAESTPEEEETAE